MRMTPSYQLPHHFRTRVGPRPGPLPEHRQSQKSVDAIKVTPEIDVFQLGVFLWRLAENTGRLVRSLCWKAVGCYALRIGLVRVL
jgi:hypothetical protein